MSIVMPVLVCACLSPAVLSLFISIVVVVSGLCCYGVLSCHALQAQVAERRKPGRKPKLDPRMLHEQRLTGEENVSVVERGSGRKVR